VDNQSWEMGRKGQTIRDGITIPCHIDSAHIRTCLTSTLWNMRTVHFHIITLCMCKPGSKLIIIVCGLRAIYFTFCWMLGLWNTLLNGTSMKLVSRKDVMHNNASIPVNWGYMIVVDYFVIAIKALQKSKEMWS